MDTIYRKFCRSLYQQTGGYIPIMHAHAPLVPGDFFQIRNGEIQQLDNIFRSNIIAATELIFASGGALNPAGFQCSDGVSKAYASRSTGQGPIEGSFEYSKQVLSFAGIGSFVFAGDAPEAVRITNWSDFQQALLIKLTTALYSFREVYVVTESVVLANWTLAVADAAQAELELATATDNFGLVDIFGHAMTKTIQAKDIAYYHREEKRRPAFIKAKKLVVRDEKAEAAINNLTHSASGYAAWATAFYDYAFVLDNTFTHQQYDKAIALDMLQANELNPNTALQYFAWAEADIDDLEKLFVW